MSEEFIKNELFTPFVQADNSPRSDYNGTGLGMPIVKQLVEKMGGTITVESKLGEGSCFTVILPFKIDTNARPEEKEDFNADTVSYTHLALMDRNRKLFFKDKGMLFTSMITPVILIVLYATFLAKVFRDSFTAAISDMIMISDKLINCLLYTSRCV